MNNPFFEEIRGRFGFGCMRLPMSGENVDLDQFQKMVDAFMEAGLNYFDTAHVYIEGQSETALRECLAKRYSRDTFILTNKLSGGCFETKADIRPLFQSQLDACGVEYFDFYLMHAQHAGNFPKYKACRAYETAFALKAEGKIRHVGISFHDKAEVLDQILTEYPEIEAVQIQFNYLDYEDPMVQSRKVYETAVRHGKPVIVMEPVKGGKLTQLPKEAQQCFDALGGGSNASYALRFASGFENMMMVLSGMSTLEQMEENLKVMTPPAPLTDAENKAINQAREIIRRYNLIACTACRYCVDGCPQRIPIPDLFSCQNAVTSRTDEDHEALYAAYTEGKGKASDCIKCGACEESCPQHLPIRNLLQQISFIFE